MEFGEAFAKIAHRIYLSQILNEFDRNINTICNYQEMIYETSESVSCRGTCDFKDFSTCRWVNTRLKGLA